MVVSPSIVVSVFIHWDLLQRFKQHFPCLVKKKDESRGSFLFYFLPSLQVTLESQVEFFPSLCHERLQLECATKLRHFQLLQPVTFLAFLAFLKLFCFLSTYHIVSIACTRPWRQKHRVYAGLSYLMSCRIKRSACVIEQIQKPIPLDQEDATYQYQTELGTTLRKTEAAFPWWQILKIRHCWQTVRNWLWHYNLLLI